MGKKLTNYLVDGCTAAYQFHRAEEISLGFLISFLESIRYENPSWNLHHLKGGMSALSEGIIKKLNPDFIHLEEEVEVVEKSQKSKNTYTVKTKKQQYEFDLVVFATTPNIAAKLSANTDEEVNSFLRKVESASTISVAYKVPKDLLPKNSVTWCPYIESKAICSFTNESMKGDDVIVNGETLVLVWLHEEFAKQIIEKSDSEIYEQVKTELVKILKLEKNISEFKSHDIQRWKEAMPKFKQGHLKNVKSFWESSQGKNNIFVAGDYMNFPWTEGAIQCGQKVAEMILQKVEKQD